MCLCSQVCEWVKQFPRFLSIFLSIITLYTSTCYFYYSLTIISIRLYLINKFFNMVSWFNYSLNYSCNSVSNKEKSYFFFQIIPTVIFLKAFDLLGNAKITNILHFIHINCFLIITVIPHLNQFKTKQKNRKQVFSLMVKTPALHMGLPVLYSWLLLLTPAFCLCKASEAVAVAQITWRPAFGSQLLAPAEFMWTFEYRARGPGTLPFSVSDK